MNKASNGNEVKLDAKTKANIDIKSETKDKHIISGVMKKTKSNEATFNSNNDATSSDLSNPVTEKTVPFMNSKWQSNIDPIKPNYPNLKQPTLPFLTISKDANQHQKDETFAKINKKILHYRSISQTSASAKKKSRKAKK